MRKIGLRDTFIYTIVKYIALGLGFFRELVNAHTLGPDTLGILGNLILILSYFLYANLGVIYAMTKECSVFIDDEKKVKKVIDATFSLLCVITLFFLCGGILNLIISGFSQFSIYIMFISVIAIFENFKLFFTNYFRIRNSLKEINNIEVIYNVVSTILTLALIPKMGIIGALIALLIANILSFFNCLVRAEKFEFIFEKAIIIKLIKIGIPLLIYNLGYYIFSTIDRLVIIKYLTNTDLGYYTFASQISKATLMFLNSVLFVYYPTALKRLYLDEKDKDKTKIKNIMEFIKQYNMKIEIIGVLLIVVGVILVIPFVHIFMEKYIPSINIYRILVLSVIANQMSYFISVFFLANNMQIKLVYLQIFTSVIALGLNILFIELGGGLYGIALATLICNFIYSILQLFILSKELRFGNFLGTLINMYGRFLLFTTIIVVLITINSINFGIFVICIIVSTSILYLRRVISMIRKQFNIPKGGI